MLSAQVRKGFTCAKLQERLRRGAAAKATYAQDDLASRQGFEKWK